MKKARNSRISFQMIDGEIAGHSYGDSAELGVLICRAAYDLIDSDPEMLKPMAQAMRKVIRMKRIDRLSKWIYEHIGYAFYAVFFILLLGCCIVI